MPEAVGRARVVARNVPLELGNARIQVERASVDLLPRGGVVDLGSRQPQMDVHAARIDLSGRTVARVARARAAKAGVRLAVHLTGQQGFEATGSFKGMPFTARGRLGASDGEFTVAPTEVDLTDRGAAVRVDVPAARASVHVPSATILGLLGAAPFPGARGRGRAKLVNPTIAWTGDQAFTLCGGLATSAGTLPIRASATVAPSPDGKLAIRVAPVQVDIPGVPTSVDLATGTATATIPRSTLARAIRSQPGWSSGRLEWLAPRTVEVSARIQVARQFVRFIGPTAALTATADLAVQGGKIQAVPEKIDVGGQGMTISYSAASQSATLHMTPAALATALTELTRGKATVEQIRWTGPSTVEATVTAEGEPFVITAQVAPVQDGRIALTLSGIQAVMDPAGDRADLSIAPSTHDIRARVSPQSMSRWLAGRGGLGAVSLSPLGGDRVKASTWTHVLGIPLPVDLQGHLAVGSDGEATLRVDQVHTFGLPILGLLHWAGKSLGALAPGRWTGDTLHLSMHLPAGLHLANLRTDNGAFEADFGSPASLFETPAGLRFDGQRLEIDPARFMPMPGTVTGFSGDATGLSVQIKVDPATLASQIHLPEGVSFDGRQFAIDPGLLTGTSIPGKLEAISGSSAGLTAEVALDSSVLGPLEALPAGVTFRNDRFVVDPASAGFQGRIVSVAGKAGGVDLQVALSRQELAGLWRSGVKGVSWNGQVLRLDPSALEPGISARAQGVVVRNGDLVADLGDGSPLPSATGPSGIHLTDAGWVKVDGDYVQGLDASVMPGAPGAPIDLATLAADHVRINAGRVFVPAAQIDALIKQSLSPARYARYRPRYVGGKIVAHVRLGPFSTTLDLSFARGADGKLELVADGFLGSLATGGRPVMAIDIGQKMGVGVAPLRTIQAGARGLDLTFGP